MGAIECATEPLYCRSVGWLVADTDACKVIVPHLAGEKGGEAMQGSGDLTIPNSAVVKMRTLRA